MIKLNPMFYIIEGYRNALIHQTWFWSDFGLTLYFVTIASIVIVIGAVVFKRLRPHFGDVL